MSNNQELINSLKSLLGDDVYNDKNQLDRAKMASIIFKDRDILEKVNAIVHPAVRKDYLKWRAEQNAPYTIQESALTFEIEAEKYVDGVLLVYAPEELLIERSMKRGNVSREQVIDRLSKQMDQELKKEKANYVINNSLGVSLIKQVILLHEILQ